LSRGRHKCKVKREGKREIGNGKMEGKRKMEKGEEQRAKRANELDINCEILGRK